MDKGVFKYVNKLSFFKLSWKEGIPSYEGNILRKKSTATDTNGLVVWQEKKRLGTIIYEGLCTGISF